jgi:hypothetical protein
LYSGTYLVRSLGDISLEHQSLLNFMEDSLGFVEGGSVDADYSSVSLEPYKRGCRHTVKSTRNSLEDSLADVLRLEIYGDDLWTDGFGHCESGGDCVDCVYLGSSLEEGPLDGAELGLGLVIP